VPTLVRLRLANAERHVQLDPDTYRLPDVETVRAPVRRNLRAEHRRRPLLLGGRVRQQRDLTAQGTVRALRQ
jgi:hypothetical protein